jgi:hypothetical protein
MKFGLRLSCVATLAAMLVGPGDARAQGLTLQVSNGLVTLQADAVPVRQILERWAQIVGMTVVNADTIPATLVTLQFDLVPERTALETLLRDVRGYIVVRRQGVGAPIERIVIANAGSAPATQPPFAQPVAAFAAVSDAAETVARADDFANSNGSVAHSSATDVPPAVAVAPRRDVPSNPFGITTGATTLAGGSTDPFGTASGAARPGTITPVQTTQPIIIHSSGGEVIRPPAK